MEPSQRITIYKELLDMLNADADIGNALYICANIQTALKKHNLARCKDEELVEFYKRKPIDKEVLGGWWDMNDFRSRKKVLYNCIREAQAEMKKEDQPIKSI